MLCSTYGGETEPAKSYGVCACAVTYRRHSVCAISNIFVSACVVSAGPVFNKSGLFRAATKKWLLLKVAAGLILTRPCEFLVKYFRAQKIQLAEIRRA